MSLTYLVKKGFSLSNFILLCLLMILVALLSSCSSDPVEATVAGPFSYSQDVVPILADRCVKCHGNDKQEGQLDLSSYAAMMAGGKSGNVIVPGKADESKLISLISSGKMPKRGAKLTSDQIRILTDWVNAGAQDN